MTLDTMLKKRIIFTLLFDSGGFMLSRNFRLQRVGDLLWLQRNYNFSKIAFFIDELIVLDVTRGQRDFEFFCTTLKALAEGCFLPIAAGGGVRTLDQAKQLLRSGADKIVINTPLFREPRFVEDLTRELGQQCVVGSIDMKRNSSGKYQIATQMGYKLLDGQPIESMRSTFEACVGELYLNSVDRDGTGQGYDFGVLDELYSDCSLPVIIAGGVGRASHLFEGLSDPRVDAVATANLLNFVGDGLKKARESLLSRGINLAAWPTLAEIGIGELAIKRGND